MTDQEFVALAKSGDAEAVKTQLQAFPNLANASEDGVSALLWSIYYGHPEIGRIIADVRCGNLDIFEATALGDRHVLENILKSHREQIDEFAADGFTALGLAAYFGHREIVDDLIKAGANPNIASKNGLGVVPLHSALSGGHKEIARALVEAGTDVNTPSKEGWFPLHYVAHSGDLETADYLLSNGASTSQKNNISETPAMVARDQGFADLADILE